MRLCSLGTPLPGFIYATGLRFCKSPSQIRIRTFLLRLQVIFESLYLSTSLMGRTRYTNPWVPEGHIHVRRSAKLYKRAPKCQSLSIKNLLIFVWKIGRTPLPVIDKDNHLSKPNFYLFVLQMKSSSICLINASLCEGPFFYFYVESPPSTFMHRLKEHSCHSEFNVHSPKVFHWLIHDYGFTCS
jgi:hypothetical protein